jgi:hypothetical protein
MATSQNPAPKDAGLAQSIINEGQKVAQAAKPVDQNAVKAAAVAASQPGPTPQAQPEAAQVAQQVAPPQAQPTPQAPARAQGTLESAHINTPGNISISESDYAEFKRWKDFGEKHAEDVQMGNEFIKFKESQAKAASTQAPVSSGVRSKDYGPGAVLAQRNGLTQMFSATTWKELGGDQNKVGYKRVVSTPPEVADLKK